MNYRHLLVRCNCGEVPDRLAEVGFTEDHQLAVHWWCNRCQRVVYILKSLTDCWNECPAPDRSLDHALSTWKGQEEVSEKASDEQFLRSIGVRA